MFRSVLGIGRSNHVPCEANHPVRFMINHADTHSFLNRDHKLLTSIKLYTLHLVPSIYLSAICASNLSSWSRVRAPALSASAGVGRKVDTPPLGGDQEWYHVLASAPPESSFIMLRTRVRFCRVSIKLKSIFN